MARNPKWSRDELILALDLYRRVSPLHTSKSNPEIKELSALLNRLPIHAERAEEGVFRNPNAVYMKMCNFLRFDPDYEGSGLTRGGRVEEDVWNEFASDPARLAATARAIRDAAATIDREAVLQAAGDEEEFMEGRVLTAIHKRRERNPRAVESKKRQVLAEKGTLACEVCGFDFAATYASLGEGFAECHHKVPLHLVRDFKKTRLSDLAILCANCHRMIHRATPMMSVEDLQSRILCLEPSILINPHVVENGL